MEQAAGLGVDPAEETSGNALAPVALHRYAAAIRQCHPSDIDCPALAMLGNPASGFVISGAADIGAHDPDLADVLAQFRPGCRLGYARNPIGHPAGRGAIQRRRG